MLALFPLSVVEAEERAGVGERKRRELTIVFAERLGDWDYVILKTAFGRRELRGKQ